MFAFSSFFLHFSLINVRFRASIPQKRFFYFFKSPGYIKKRSFEAQWTAVFSSKRALIMRTSTIFLHPWQPIYTSPALHLITPPFAPFHTHALVSFSYFSHNNYYYFFTLRNKILLITINCLISTYRTSLQKGFERQYTPHDTPSIYNETAVSQSSTTTPKGHQVRSLFILPCT